MTTQAIKEVLEIIDDMIKTEKGCMKEDTYEEQILEHQFTIEGLKRLKQKIEEAKNEKRFIRRC